MRKINLILLILLLPLLSLFLACNDEPKIIVDSAKVDSAMMAIFELEEIDIKESNINRYEDDINNAKELYDGLNLEEKKFIENEDLEYLEGLVDMLEKKKQIEADALKAFEETKEYIDNRDTCLYQDLDLASFYDTSKGRVYISYTSSDIYHLSNTLKVYPGLKDTDVILECKMSIGSNSYTYKKDFVVKAFTNLMLPAKKVIGYVYSGVLNGFSSFSSKDLETMDIVNYCFARINDDFSLDIEGINSHYLKVLSAKSKGVKICLCIGGFGVQAVNFSKASANAQTRHDFVKMIADTVEKYNFDGVDIDWEYPTYYGSENSEWLKTVGEENDKNNYNLFMKDLYDELKGRNVYYIVSTAIPGGSTYKRFNLAGLAKNHSYDFINLMTYDSQSGSYTSHHAGLNKATYSPFSVADSVASFVSAGIAKKDIIIGCAWYGYIFKLESEIQGNITLASVMGKTYTTQSSVGYDEIYEKYLKEEKNGVHVFYDEVCSAPIIYDANNNVVITYENERSIKDKCSYIINNGYGGIMFWCYRQDTTGNLISAIYEGLK